MVFQERLDKELELRTIVVGRQVFTAAVDSRASELTAVDWRRGARELAGAWSAYALPAEVEARLVELVARMRLSFGAIDLVLTPDGRHVFLELNPQGEFAWLADGPPHLAIAPALAELLVRGARGSIR
jgi:glutathione synthase/RimK-type ligase-like ATP-grasp enzyme